jgi:outer membrane protein assembly factor BamE (lipoprotein component of BamABCDE complex)
MFISKKKHINLIIFCTFFILIGCQFQEPTKNHGIFNLEKRANKLTININNFNDVIKIIGQPHTKSIDDKNTWIYFERILTKGKYYKLGQNLIKKNNVLVLEFDKYGVLKNKIFLDKNNLNNLNFTKNETENNITQKSLVENVLQSIRQKMYRNR